MPKFRFTDGQNTYAPRGAMAWRGAGPRYIEPAEYYRGDIERRNNDALVLMVCCPLG